MTQSRFKATWDALTKLKKGLRVPKEAASSGRIRLQSTMTLTDKHIDALIVNHLGILYKLCSVGIGGSVLSILTQYLLNRSQIVMVDGCRSKLVNIASGVPQGSVPPVHDGAFHHFGK